MKSFTNYVQQKTLETLMSEVAHQMVEADVNPYDVLIEYYKNNPEVVIKLESQKEELNEFLQGLKNITGAAWNAVKGAGQNVKTAAGALGQGLMSTGKQARDDAFGPEAKYKVALQSLKSLADELNNNKEVQGAIQDPQYGSQTTKVVKDLMGIQTQLQQQQQQVVDYLKRMKEKQTVSQTQPTRGANPGAPVPGYTAPGTQQPQQQAQVQQFPTNNTAAATA